ncbi:MAG: PAS domain S-box protein [Promethearchaeota archaeon]
MGKKKLKSEDFKSLKIEEDLCEHQLSLQTLFDSVQDLIFVLNFEGKILKTNKKVLECLGYSEKEILNMNVFDIHPAERREEAAAVIKDIIDEKLDLCLIPLVTKDGKLIHVETKATKGKWRNRDVLFGISRDITERQIFEEKLVESEKKFSKAFNSNSVAMAISTFEEGRFIEVNDYFLRELGYKREEIIGKTAFDINLWFDKRERKEIKCIIKENGRVSNLDVKFNTKNGQIRHGLFSSTKIEINNMPYLLTLVNDITDRIKIEQELKKSEKKYREAYDQAKFYKDIFAHDINNILQNILSAYELSRTFLEQPENQNKFRSTLDIIKEQVIRGSKLVSNIRWLSQLEEYKKSLKKVKIMNILKKSIEFIKNSYQEKNINIQVDLIDEDLCIEANDLIQDVFENILINGVKHNKNKIVEILIKFSKEKIKEITYHKIEIIDNGIGIEDHWKDKIFQRRYTEDKSFSGMGLGLSLVKRIIDNLNGKIWVEDKIEGDHTKGSNFIILIPIVK